MTMLVMLGVLYMLIDRAKDTSTWTALVGKSAVEDSSTIHAEDFPENQHAQPSAKQPPVKRPSQTPAQAPKGTVPPIEKPRSETVAEVPAAEVSKADIPPAETEADAKPAAEAPRADAPPAETPAVETVPKEAAPKEAAPDDGLATDVPPPEAADQEAPPEKTPKDGAADVDTDDVPNDLDPAEQEAAQRDFQTVFDKENFTVIDMPAYWRLYKWAKSQSAQSLRARGRRDLLFTHLWERPSQYRGQLIRLNLLHLRRILSYNPEIENHKDVRRVYEAWGVTDESRLNPYVIVFTDLPEGMPLGPDVHEDVTFSGYFLKILPYVAADDKQRGAPLLIGRVIWHPVPKVEAPKVAEWQWGLMFGGAVLVLLLLLQWLPNRLRRGDKSARLARGPLNTGDEDAIPIDDWLEQAETPGTPETLEYADGHGPNGTPGINGNGASDFHRDRLDGSKDLDG